MVTKITGSKIVAKVMSTLELVFVVSSLAMLVGGLAAAALTLNWQYLLLTYIGFVGYLVFITKSVVVSYISSWLTIETYNGQTLDNIVAILDDVSKNQISRSKNDMDLIKKLNGLS